MSYLHGLCWKHIELQLEEMFDEHLSSVGRKKNNAARKWVYMEMVYKKKLNNTKVSENIPYKSCVNNELYQKTAALNMVS